MLITDFALLSALVLANVLGVGMLVPQAQRTWRTGTLDGVSATWIGGGVAINAGWLVYAVRQEVWGVLPVSAGSLILYAAIAAVARRIDPRGFERMLIAALAIASLLGWTTFRGGVEALGLGLAALYTVQFAPAALTAVTSRSLDGVAPSTWIMALIEAAIWWAYGAIISDAAVMLGGIGATAMSAVVVLRSTAGASRPAGSSYG
jgi:uncharacterized protein with PQ loop repeat